MRISDWSSDLCSSDLAVCPDYSEVAKLTDHWLHPKQGTDAALAFAFGHVILKEFHVDNPSQYFTEYCRRYSDMPLLVRLEKRADGRLVPERFTRASDLGGLGDDKNQTVKQEGAETAKGRRGIDKG